MGVYLSNQLPYYLSIYQKDFIIFTTYFETISYECKSIEDLQGVILNGETKDKVIIYSDPEINERKLKAYVQEIEEDIDQVLDVTILD